MGLDAKGRKIKKLKTNIPGFLTYLSRKKNHSNPTLEEWARGGGTGEYLQGQHYIVFVPVFIYQVFKGYLSSNYACLYPPISKS